MSALFIEFLLFELPSFNFVALIIVLEFSFNFSPIKSFFKDFLTLTIDYPPILNSLLFVPDLS